MITIITILMFFTSFIYIYLITTRLYKDKIIIAERMERLKIKRDDTLDELSLPFYQRIIKPLGKDISGWVSGITPSKMKGAVSEKLVEAGTPYNIGVTQWLLLKAFCGIVIPTGIFFIISYTTDLTSKSMLIFIVSFVFSFYFPNLWLKQMTTKRQKEITNTLPDVLDLLTVSVEAGLSFDGALSRVVNKVEGQLSKEFGRLLNEIRMGRSRKEALKEMSSRCNVTDLTTFVSAIVQADELGVGISNVLRIQSKQMREKRRQRAQEKAMKAPVKMLFPLVLFIFPTIFSVLLGPAMIRIINEFM